MKKNLLTMLFIIAIQHYFFGTTFYVPSQYSTIQAGLNAAENAPGTGHIVQVAQGTYYENIIWPIKDGLKLYGASFTDSSLTTINGNWNGSSVISFPGTYYTITTATEIKGFTITNGLAEYGGGIFCSHSSPTLTNLIIRNNKSTYYGGGLYIVTVTK